MRDNNAAEIGLFFSPTAPPFAVIIRVVVFLQNQKKPKGFLRANSSKNNFYRTNLQQQHKTFASRLNVLVRQISN